jgi:Tol biopolymer transport system component
MKWSVLVIAMVVSMVQLACTDHGPLSVPENPATAIMDGSEIAFVSSRGQWPSIYLAHGDATRVRRLTLGTAPSWAPDGRQLAFRREANPYDRAGIYIINADGSGERFLGVGWSPAWGSNGQVAFAVGGGASDGSIAVMNPDDGRIRHLLRGSSISGGNACEDGWLTPHVDHPAWSPDSRRIVFVLTCVGEWSRLFVMNADGSGARLLVDHWQAYAPAWSPDGTRIAATVDGAIGIVDLRSGAWSIHDHARAGTRLDWSPDGRQLLFSAGDPGRERIFVLDLQTSDARQLIPGTSQDHYSDSDAAWSRWKP